MSELHTGGADGGIATLFPARPAADTRGLPRVNLLPGDLAAARHARRVQAGLALAVLAAVGGVGGLWYTAHQSVSRAQAQLTSAQGQVSSLNARVASYGDVRAVFARVDAAESTVRAALGTEVLYSKLLTDLALDNPGRVWFTSLDVTQQPVNPAPGIAGGIATIQVDGLAYSHDDVARWLDALGRQSDLADVTISDSEDTPIGAKTLEKFTSSASLTSGALSQRYTDGVGPR